MPKRRCRASWTSASVGAVRSVAKVKHLLHYLPHCRQRVQLAPLHLVQQASQLRVAGNGLLQMHLRAAGRHREDLTGQVLPAPLLELTVLLEVRAMLLDLRPQLRDVLTARRLGEDDRRLPRAVTIEREDR